jgi:hypothetical protein
MSVDEIQLFHEEIMQEEGIKLSDLPIEIQKKIKGFNLMKATYEKNPQERTLINLKKRAVSLGDEVQSFIENDYEDEDEDEEEDNSSSKSEKDGQKKDGEKTSKQKSENKSEEKSEKPVKQKPVTTGGSFGNLMMEKKILAVMQSKGENRIKISDLQSIIGREPEYPEQKVNNIKLRKVFLSSDYRLV